LSDRDLSDQIDKASGEVLGSLRIRGRVLDRDHLLQVALGLNDRAAAEMGQGCYQLAEALCQRALDIFEKVAVPDDPRLAAILDNYAGLMECTARAKEAAPLRSLAAAIHARPEERFFAARSRGPDSRIQSK
jgi:Tetratricopeptide repeat